MIIIKYIILFKGHGKCGVAVVRISGSHAKVAIENMTNLKKPTPRKAYFKNIVYPATSEVIDQGLCLWFPGTILQFFI